MNCTICYSNYNTPVVNTCGHTFCRKCILEYKKRISKCPLCRAPLNEHLPTNYALLDLLDDKNIFQKYSLLFYIIILIDVILFLFSEKYKDIIIILLHIILSLIFVTKITIETIKIYKNISIIEYIFMLMLPLLILPKKYHLQIIILTTTYFAYSLLKRFYL